MSRCCLGVCDLRVHVRVGGGGRGVRERRCCDGWAYPTAERLGTRQVPEQTGCVAALRRGGGVRVYTAP